MDILRKISEKKFVDILDHVPGKKDLIIDPTIMKPLDRITGVNMLRAHGVEKIHKLERAEISSSNSSLVYLIYADLITAKHVVDQVHASRQKDVKSVYHLILVPCKLLCIDQLIEEEGLHSIITMHVFAWELIPLDSQVLSFEIPHFYKATFLNADYSLLKSVAKSLWSLQLVFGKIPLVLSQGKHAKLVQNMINSYFEDLGEPDKLNSKIGYMVLMDRNIDYATSLLTSVTYTGLLDEVFGVKCGTVEFSKDVTGKSNPITYLLNSKDEIYNEIKYKHFSDVYPTLRDKAKELENELSKFKTADISTLKQQIESKMRNIMTMRQSLAYHIGACERIIGNLGSKYQELQTIEENVIRCRNKRETISYIEDCLARQVSWSTALRLICLLSLTECGLSSDEYVVLKSQFLHSYGYKHLETFYHMESLGLFPPQMSNPYLPSAFGGVGDTAGKLANRMAQVVSLPKTNSFKMVAQKLKLFPDATSGSALKDPSDMGYVFNGVYIPVVCQLVQLLLKKESRATIEELLKVIPGPTLWEECASETKSYIRPRIVIVFLIGGVTQAEIAALQLLENLTDSTIIVAGTSMINGNLLVQQFVQS